MASAVVLRARVRVRAWSALTTGFLEGDGGGRIGHAHARAAAPRKNHTQ